MLSIRRRVLLSAWIPAAICVVLIAISSSDTFSSDSTSHILRPFAEGLFGHFANRVWDKLLYDLRKTGHFFGYGFVSVVFFRAWRMTFPAEPRLLRSYGFPPSSSGSAAFDPGAVQLG